MIDLHFHALPGRRRRARRDETEALALARGRRPVAVRAPSSRPRTAAVAGRPSPETIDAGVARMRDAARGARASSSSCCTGAEVTIEEAAPARRRDAARDLASAAARTC